MQIQDRNKLMLFIKIYAIHHFTSNSRVNIFKSNFKLKVQNILNKNSYYFYQGIVKFSIHNLTAIDICAKLEGGFSYYVTIIKS